MRHQRLFVLAIVLGLPVLAWAQPKENDPEQKPEPTELVIDLAQGRILTWEVEAATYTVRLSNAVPGREYFLRTGPNMPLQLPELKGAATTTERVAPKTTTDKDSCPSLAAARKALASAALEAAVPKLVDDVRVALATTGECPNEKALANEVVGQTRPVMSHQIKLDAESARRITVASSLGDTWSLALSSAGRGVWQSSYGFVFSPNHDEDFFTEQTGDEAFVIRREKRDKNSITFLPSVFYTWLSTSQAFENFQHGPTIGVGLTTNSGRLGAMLGYSLRFNQNIGITAGVNVYPHRRLGAKYHEGQVLKEALEADQLNKNSVRGNLFVAFTLRLGTSPFGQ